MGTNVMEFNPYDYETDTDYRTRNGDLEIIPKFRNTKSSGDVSVDQFNAMNQAKATELAQYEANHKLQSGAKYGAGAALGAIGIGTAIKATKTGARGFTGRGLARGLASGERSKRRAAAEYINIANKFRDNDDIEAFEKYNKKANKLINKADKIANKKLMKLDPDSDKARYLKSRLGKSLAHTNEIFMSEIDNVFNFSVID